MSKLMGFRGVCWDNPVAETLFAALKKKMVYHRSWPTRQGPIREIFEYVERSVTASAGTPTSVTVPGRVSKSLAARRTKTTPPNAYPASACLSTEPGDSVVRRRSAVVYG
jgi:hypothetical protein